MLGKAAVILGGIAAAGVFTPDIASAVSPALRYDDIPGTGDIKVLNFALALEDLEADLYAQAIQRLGNGGTNKLGKKIKGLNISSSQPDVIYVKRFAKVEVEHRDFLRTAIKAAGGPVIPQFKYGFRMESKTRQQVVELVYLAEVTGVMAYLGAIPLVANKTYLSIAAAIQGTEARHTAVVAAVLNQVFGGSRPTAPLFNDNDGRDVSMPPNLILKAVSPFIVV